MMSSGATTNGGINPFTSEERENFPEWSPLFSKNSSTPSNLKQKKTFHWSIDQMAKLKPVDIATSPASLAITNVMSPHDNPVAQKKADEYFSQRNILPSPWTGGGNGPIAKAKHVTFSPLPPTTSYYNDEDTKKVDASTQTCLTLPVDLDLEKILGQEYYTGEDNSFTLRRKLFGHPQRESESSQTSRDNSYIEPKTHDTQLSSTPLRSSPLSPAVFITKLSSEGATPPPLSSSFLEKGSSPLLSPIKSGDGLQLSPIMTDKRNGSGLSSAPPISPPLSPILSSATATCTSGGADTAGDSVGVALNNELNGSYTCSTADEGNDESSPIVQSKLST
ncbi:PREDICTED: protein aurora borealis-like [Amphimedon queenslandica]|uniref:Protein aurora borealis n=1 Tax=Amphimedon queenslandica TaxID=400682 RepID=A0AAN0JDL7_AMPQE|nr:PREDICTED: protein aurora borealis-like [Amphimedon queenslandica]|eukprot:XP_019855125.1 PREDICTED: protein aurora borealis-like [Amphimedon queenslandica]